MATKQTNVIVAVIGALLVGNTIAKDQDEQHAHSFAPDVEAFHSVLAPLWHAHAGKERSRNVCAQSPDLERLAQAIRSANPKPLLTSIAALRAQCKTDPADIDNAFSQVHDSFHRLAEHNEH